jgi:hypothetical protein
MLAQQLCGNMLRPSHFFFSLMCFLSRHQ